MTRPILREFRVDDVEKIVNRDGTQCEPQLIAMQATAGPSFTAELNGAPIGCGGIVRQWPGVGLCWMVVSDDIQGHGIWLTRVTKEFIFRTARMLQLHRLEASAVVDSPRNQAWLEAIGFTKERNAVAREYLPNRQDVIRYEKTGAAWQA